MAITVKIGTSALELVQGDITEQSVDAIVNAASAELAGGGGVDGAIHRAGGEEIMAECRAIGGCLTGEAVITTAGKLPAKKVIHAVAPRYRDGQHGEPKKLASAYSAALELVAKHGLKSVALPSLGTGAYGYPVNDAAFIAVGTTMDFLGRHPEVELARFVLFDAATLDAFERACMDQAPTRKIDTQ